MEKKEENFELLMSKLEEITDKLENQEDISLDESIKLFEEGIQISKKCSEQIEKVEKKITMLVDDNGELKEENFVPNVDE